MSERLSPEEFADRVAQVAAETASPAGSLWWLSFADPSLPAGTQFLGACLVEADSLPAAVTRSHLLGINPGGEVAIVGPLDPGQPPPGYPLDRLLTREEIVEADDQ